MKNFNLSKDEKEDIVKKMTELLELCQIYHCPMFATVAVSNNQIKTEYENICFGSNANQISLTDDQIRQHILIAGSDFVAVPKRDSVEMDIIHLFFCLLLMRLLCLNGIRNDGFGLQFIYPNLDLLQKQIRNIISHNY